MKEFYVLHYNIETCAYGNNIIPKDFYDAMMEYIVAYPTNDKDRVELIYSPAKGNNIVVISKGANPISLNTTTAL